MNLGFSRFLNAMIYETIETSRYEYLCLLRKLATFIQSEFWITFWDDSCTSPALCGSFERGSTKQALYTDLDIATQHPNHFLHVKLHPKPFSKTYRVRFSKLTGPIGRGNGSTVQPTKSPRFCTWLYFSCNCSTCCAQLPLMVASCSVTLRSCLKTHRCGGFPFVYSKKQLKIQVLFKSCSKPDGKMGKMGKMVSTNVWNHWTYFSVSLVFPKMRLARTCFWSRPKIRMHRMKKTSELLFMHLFRRLPKEPLEVWVWKMLGN